MSTDSFSISFDTAAIDKWADELQADVQQALRPAAQAGADVLYRQVLANVPVGTKGHWFHGSSYAVNGTKYWYNAGALRRAVYQAHATKASTSMRPVYSVGVNPRKAPYANMVELGTARAAPVKYIGRARAQVPAALDAAQAKLFNSLKLFK